MIKEFITGVIFVAIIYSLVRPGSPASTAIENIFKAMVAVVGSATGYNTFGDIKL